jgi:hypothetical protein
VVLGAGARAGLPEDATVSDRSKEVLSSNECGQESTLEMFAGEVCWLGKVASFEGRGRGNVVGPSALLSSR